MAFARHVFGGDASAAPDHNAVASAVFSSPPISTVGLTEAQAVEQFGDVNIYTSSFRWARHKGFGNRDPNNYAARGCCPQKPTWFSTNVLSMQV